MGDLLKKVDPKQFRWGIIAGVITVVLMAISYNIGYGRGEEGKVLGETEVQEEAEIREVQIEVKENCQDLTFEEIREGKKEIKKYCLDFSKGENVFNAMKRLDEKEEEFSFDFEVSDFGVFITSINNFHPDVDSKFWAFYVNDEMSMVGVKDYKIEKDDLISFKLEEIEL